MSTPRTASTRPVADTPSVRSPLPATDGPRPVVAMVAYPGMTLLDLVGPHTTLAATMDVHIASTTLDDLVTDSGAVLRPTTTFADAPQDVDVLFVPGGAGAAEAITDEQLLTFVTDRGSRARWVTSVCTGSLVLGAAGLLRGYRATSHWTGLDLLPLFGAEVATDRVVVDRDRITGGGVTAGIDFGLTLLELLQGRQVAEMTQLAMEYDPHPPFDSGSPATADPAHVAALRAGVEPVNQAVRAAVAQRGLAVAP